MDGETVILLLSSIYICLWRCERQTDRERERHVGTACGRVCRRALHASCFRGDVSDECLSLSLCDPHNKNISFTSSSMVKTRARFGSVRFGSTQVCIGEAPHQFLACALYLDIFL